ncbi:DNA cross-link repair 1A protein [Discoglossus pictus]
MSENETLEDDIWEYKSSRKNKQDDSSGRITTLKEGLEAQKPLQECVRKSGLIVNTKQNKKNKSLNAHKAQPGPSKDQNKTGTQNGHKQLSETDIITPAKKKTENKKQSPKTPQPRSEGHCPSCQMPFSILLVQTPRWHVSECLDTQGAAQTECPDGVLCSSTIPSHYKRYTHYRLAQSRAVDNSIYSQTYTLLQTYPDDTKSDISANNNNASVNRTSPKSKSPASSQDSKSPKSKSPASSQNSKSPKSKSPASSQESVKWTSLDAWISSPSKNDTNLRSQSYERLSNYSTHSLGGSETPCLPQQDADLSDCAISYSPLLSDEELDGDDKLKTSIKRLFSSESSEDNCVETEQPLNGRQHVKNINYHGNTKSHNENTNIINKCLCDHLVHDDHVCQPSAGASNYPESAGIDDYSNWLECSSPASGVGDWDTKEFCLTQEFDDRAIASTQVHKVESTLFPNKLIVGNSDCVNSRDKNWYTSSQRLQQPLPENTSKVGSTFSSTLGEKESLPLGKETAVMPSKTLSGSSGNTVPAKGLKQMDIGIFFGLKPKPKVEIAEVKPKIERKSVAAPVSGVKPAQRKRKAEGSVGDTEALTDNTNIQAATGGQQRWQKKFRQSSTGDEGKGKKQCPFYKKIPGTGFSVDAFQYGEIEGCSAYFLTHFHSDHYGGLTKKFRFPIYCSQITGNLVQSKLRVEKQFINTLPMNTECIVNNIKVVLLEANHCPGAVLLLFILPNGTRVLHTGDFRADPSMEDYPALIGQTIHSLYLDTTYCSPEYTFPPQQEAIQFAVNTAFEMVTLYPRTLVVCGTYSVGKERVFLAIADILGCKVSMSQDKYKTMQCLESEEVRSVVTTDFHSTALHVLPMMQVNFKGLYNHLNKFSGKYDRVLAFKPTGWTYSEGCNSVADIKPEIRGKVTLYGIPYSEHSSYSEMKRFVQWIRPQKIIPTVNVGNAKVRSTMEKYFKDWLTEVAWKPMGKK